MTDNSIKKSPFFHNEQKNGELSNFRPEMKKSDNAIKPDVSPK